GKLLEALLAAARRGVRVAVLVPADLDHNLVRWASRRHYGELMRAGAEVHEYRAGVLHAKTMVIDGVWTTVGSTHVDNRAFAINDELNLIVYDRAFANRLEGVFSRDLAQATLVHYRQWRHRSFSERVEEWLALPLRDHL